MTERRAVVTGVGLVTPVGVDRESTWRALLEGRSGIARIGAFPTEGLPASVGAAVPLEDPVSRIGDLRVRKYANRAHAFALLAAEEAVADAGEAPIADVERAGCVVGGGMLTVASPELREIAPRMVVDGVVDRASVGRARREIADPRVFCRTQTNAGLWMLARRFGIRGPTTSVHTACASGGQAVGMGLRWIRRGRADRVLAGGFDSMLDPVGFASFCRLGALSPDDDPPERASRPFDRTRNGFVLGEGAGFLVLEERESAIRRGARIRAEIAGEGTSLSGYRITDSHPSGTGPIEAIERALADARIDRREIGYVNAHGTSTLMNDRAEAAALRSVFGEALAEIWTGSTKSWMGHLIAAAGAVEAAITVMAVERGIVPPHGNCDEPDPECPLRIPRDGPERWSSGAALSNAFGFGGVNSTLVVAAADGAAR